ncbi:MAG: membrane protein insertion efficiency factor YidD [Candidatus Pacearchaeota archaeon]
MRKLFISFIRLYQKFISPLLPRSCRFYPSCSEYAVQCFECHNVFYAIFLTMKRILKCNPLFEGGFDPVPCSHIKHSYITDENYGRKKF